MPQSLLYRFTREAANGRQQLNHARYAAAMTTVSMRDLRNHGGQVVDRVVRGERITITRAGTEVAELHALRPRLSAEALLERWHRLLALDPATLRLDTDELLDSSL